MLTMVLIMALAALAVCGVSIGLLEIGAARSRRRC